MALSKLDRARIILDLIRDGDVTDESVYATVDKIGAAVGDKVVSALYAAYGPINDGDGNPLAYADLTNDEKGTFYINTLLDWHWQHVLAQRVAQARETAAETERTSVVGELNDELGGREDYPVRPPS